MPQGNRRVKRYTNILILSLISISSGSIQVCQEIQKQRLKVVFRRSHMLDIVLRRPPSAQVKLYSRDFRKPRGRKA